MSHSFSQHHGTVLGAGDTLEKRDTALTTRRADLGWRLNEITGHKAKHCGPLSQVPVKFLKGWGFVHSFPSSEYWARSLTHWRYFSKCLLNYIYFLFIPRQRRTLDTKGKNGFCQARKQSITGGRWWPAWSLAWDQVLGQKKGQIFWVEPGIILFLKKSFLLIS